MGKTTGGKPKDILIWNSSVKWINIDSEFQHVAHNSEIQLSESPVVPHTAAGPASCKELNLDCRFRTRCRVPFADTRGLHLQAQHSRWTICPR